MEKIKLGDACEILNGFAFIQVSELLGLQMYRKVLLRTTPLHFIHWIQTD